MIDLNDSKFERLINKDEIFNVSSELEIFQHYVPEIHTSFGPINSPLRSDNHPSFNIYWADRNGKYMYKDHATGEFGDCIDLVMSMYNISYQDALVKITLDFKLPLFNLDRDKDYERRYIERLNNVKPEAKVTEISYVKRSYNKNDAAFWQSFGISSKILRVYNVIPISVLFLNSFMIKSEPLSYAYVENKDNYATVKNYQPFSSLHKFTSNNNASVIEGWTQLPAKGKRVIITSSRKDVMSIASTARIPAVAPQSENTMISRTAIDELKRRFDNVYVMYDNDYSNPKNPGRKAALRLSQEYDLKQIEINESNKSKDYSDLVYNHSGNHAVNVLKSML